jgi:predicted nucleotidyltransferase component of viral defense system
MIPRKDIIAWRSIGPWTANEWVEQDLVLSRALVEIFSDVYLKEDLAIRGGTAIHKIFLPQQARYSEDIDLVRRWTGPIKETISRLQKQLEFLGKYNVKQKERNTIIRFQFNSEIPPIVTLMLKVEINCREHDSKYGYILKDYSVHSGWFSGECSVSTYSINELLGTKLRALYQRKKGRDLFDIWYIIQKDMANIQEILDSFHHYLDMSGTRITRKQFINNIENKLNDSEFRKDIAGLIRSEIIFDFDEAWEYLKIKLVENMN